MNEKDYQYVLTVAKCQSFSQAAKLLYVSQPSLSRYISSLEKDLGVQLFDRRKSPVQTTDAGKLFCSYANSILDLENALRHDLQSSAALASKPIRIGVPLVTGEYILSRILPRILKKHPEVQIDPIQDLADTLHQRLISHQLDAAFICTPTADPAFCSDLLVYEDMYLVGRRDHPALASYDTSAADVDHPLMPDMPTLTGIPLIHCRPIAFSSYLVDEALKRCGMKPSVEIKASSMALAFDLAVQGVGFTGAMRCQIKYGHPGTTQQLCPIALENCRFPFYLAYNRLARSTISHLDIFVKEVFDEYQSAPYI